ncbi:hypothetical protein MPSEU_000136800 [Mayamaea pseudoterrestris]|nr:hypothetical protein MPSEU_000136800 [Mayamaea pseudoterrestris]
MIFSCVVGLYGISGSGKSHCLASLKQQHREWRCIEGSEMILQVMRENGDGDDLEDFKRLDLSSQAKLRSAAVQRIRELKGVTVVAGHFSFPVVSASGDVSFDNVFSDEDRETYDMILYLDVSPQTIHDQRAADTLSGSRLRDTLTVGVLQKWLDHEKSSLPRHCRSFNLLNQSDDAGQFLSELLEPRIDTCRLQTRSALRAAVQKVPAADVFLLIDGDKTITPQDTGRLFFDHMQRCKELYIGSDPLQDIFTRFAGYPFRPFIEVAMLYSSVMSVADYQAFASEVGSKQVMFHKDWVEFLQRLPPFVRPILVSSSIRETWQAALMSHDLADSMSVIAGNHLELHDYVVDPSAKAIVVEELRRLHRGCLVMAFGDSTLDVPMLQAADRGYVVVDPKHHSSSMQCFINDCVAGDCRRLYQMGLPADNDSIAYHNGLKVGNLTSLLDDLATRKIHSITHFTDDSFAKILATNSRRADFQGPQLQSVHVQIGRYLTAKLLQIAPSLTESCRFRHVQQGDFLGVKTAGKRIAIVALMRGGEPMARGVFECFPDAQFIHYAGLDLPSQALSAEQIIVVDSVVNKGGTIRNFLAAISQTTSAPQVYVLTSVIQEVAASDLPKEYPRVRFLALRVSSNQYTGTGNTDTGNRLFGTI